MVFTNMTRLTQLVHRMPVLILFLLIAVSPTLAQQAAPASSPPAAQATPEVKIEFNRRVPMRDRTELSADIYRPVGEGKFPVILNRTP